MTKFNGKKETERLRDEVGNEMEFEFGWKTVVIFSVFWSILCEIAMGNLVNIKVNGQPEKNAELPKS